jgi:hypothetical protein
VPAIVHRPTLTPRAYEYRDTGGRAVLSLQLERYELVQGVAWPHRIEAISDQGTIIVDLHDVELGAEPPPGAFVPPARARQAP